MRQGRRCDRIFRLLLAVLLGGVCTGRLAAQEKSPLDSIRKLPGAVFETDTASLVGPVRLRALPPSQRAAWERYLRRSRELAAADRGIMAAELRAARQSKMVQAPYTHYFAIEAWMTGAWFASDSGRALADKLLTWQTPSGGWSKHVDMRSHARRPGESWYGESDEWRYIGTYDNDATVTQLRILGGVAASEASEGQGKGKGRGKGDTAEGAASRSAERYRAAFLRGLAYVRASQYPNGCFPQVYPLQGGYHDAATFNDNATVNVLRLLRDVSEGRYPFVPAAERRRAGAAYDLGLDCILRSQVVIAGRRTAWGQQHDPLTLQPSPARSYELAGISGRESAWILDFLMELPHPSARVLAAVHAGADWFRAHEIRDSVYEDGLLEPSPGARGLWARNTEISTLRPIMANRDGRKLYDTALLTDRRHGYGWFGNEPAATLERYDVWAHKHPR